LLRLRVQLEKVGDLQVSQLERLGLIENPFNNLEARFFYADKNRREILEAAEQLIDNSSDLQVIIGEQGIGKSHFLAALTKQVDDNRRVVKTIDATCYDTDNLLQGILDVLGTKSLGDDVDLLEVLETQLSEISIFGFKPILFIDNAQSLSIDSIRFLIQLSQQKQAEQPYINIVLFATTQITELLQSQELINYREIIHLSTLKNFSKEDIPAYLKHKMLAAGFEREMPFTARIIDSIFNDSKGMAKDIDHFADKFLSSSGKAENYIDVDAELAASEQSKLLEQDVLLAETDNIELDSDDQVDDFDRLMNDELLESLDDISNHRSDRTEVELNRLTEQFDEIENISSQDSKKLFTEENFTEKNTDRALFDDENELAESGLPKFVIPMALAGLIVVALIVVNSVFEQSEPTSEQAEQAVNDILSLELPLEDELLKEKTNADTMTASVDSESQPEESATLMDLIGIKEGITDNKADSETVIPAEESVAETALLIEPVDDSVVNNLDSDNTTELPIVAITAPVVQLQSVKPEPIIGSGHRQTITITGNNFQADTRLMVIWPGGRKEFSQTKTPQQWHYIDKNTIKLQLITGTTAQQWQVTAVNMDSQSSAVSFDVVKPYIATLAIKEITPLPLVGSDKRQTITIRGENFSTQTVIELRWDKNKKHFSPRLTPEQFEFISSSELKLSITTGVKKRKWMVTAINPTGKKSSSSFVVVNKIPLSSPVVAIKDESWLAQQADNYYTIQLIGSSNKPAINKLIIKYKLKGDVLVYKTLRNDKPWYTITYGSYASLPQAKAAAVTFDPKLTKTPWVRTFASIKKLLPMTQSTAVIAKTAEPVVNKTIQVESVTTESVVDNGVIIEDRTLTPEHKLPEHKPGSQSKDELWIRQQKPDHYTLQLFALSSEQNINNYIKKYGIESQAAYFKTLRDGKTLYVLVYGSYKDKSSASQAAGQLVKTLKQAKPWARKFSIIHGMMIP